MPTPYQRIRELEEKAALAWDEGRYREARRLAQQWLGADTDSTTWHYGNTIHNANHILGLVAVREGELGDAKRYLLAAGSTPGSPQLDSFGPKMHLAQALLSRGERDCVLEYLEKVNSFYGTVKPTRIFLFNLLLRYHAARNRRKLMRWKAAIQTGEQPRLNRVEQSLVPGRPPKKAARSGAVPK